MKSISNKTIATLFIVYAILFNIIGGTLAYFNWKTSEGQSTNVVFTVTPDFSCAADGGGNITSANTSLSPASCTNSEHAIVREVTVDVLHNTHTDINMDLWLNVNILDSGLVDTTKFRYALTTEPDSCTEGVMLSGSFNGRQTGDKVKILNKNYSSTTNETYYLYIWLDETETSLSTMNQNFDFSISGECINTNKTAYAVYSDDDNSLTFYKTMEPIEVGDTYNGKTVTAVYKGFENTEYSEKTIPWYSYRESIKSVEVKDMISPISTARWFRDFTNCTEMDLAQLDTSKVTNMYAMFMNMKSLTELNLSSFNTSKVTNMGHMFEYMKKITNLDLSNFDTSNVTLMHSMLAALQSCVSLDVSNFNTEKVTRMDNMFADSGSNASTFTLNLGNNFDTSNVTNMSNMFNSLGFNASTFTLNLGNNFDTSNVTNMLGMFNNLGYNASTFTLNLGNSFDTSNVTNMSSMFYCLGYYASTFTLNLGNNFDTSNVTNMSNMFNRTGSYSTTTIINLGNKFDTSKVENMDNMFTKVARNNPDFVLDLGDEFVFKDGVTVTDFASECGAGKLIIPKTVTNFPSGVFKGMNNLNEIVFEHLSTSTVTLPTAGSSTGAFYTNSNINTTINTENNTIKNYSWITDNRTVTIN